MAKKRVLLKKKKQNNEGNAEKRVVALEKKLARMSTGTPFADVGGMVGSMFGPLGSNIGRWLGSGVGTIFGSGDYAVGGGPKYNMLYNSNQAPQFASSKRQNMICHREYLGDLSGSTGFSITSYPINPGQATTFPWLSTVAQSYERYKIHGMVFEFRTTSSEYNTSTAALGSVIMATDYNVLNTTFTSKQNMENFEGAMSAKPSISMLHGVECQRTATTDELFVRTGAVQSSADQRLYDLGQFEIATTGMSGAYVIGELWVTYCVEFMTPKMLDQPGGSVLSLHSFRTSVTNANPLGTVSVTQIGTLAATITASAIVFNAPIGTQFLVALNWIGGSVSLAIPAITYSGATPLTIFGNAATPDANSAINNSGTTTTVGINYAVVLTTTRTVTISFTTSGNTLPSSTNGVDILVTQVDTLINV